MAASAPHGHAKGGELGSEHRNAGAAIVIARTTSRDDQGTTAALQTDSPRLRR
jgi:hypothetical protein